MKTLRISIVFNNITWASIPEKIQAIKDFFGPDFFLDIQEFHTAYTGIPFMLVDSIGGIENTKGGTTTISPGWFTKCITALSPDADIILFCLNNDDDNPPRTSVGIMQGKFADVMQACIFGINENDHAYINGIDQGNCFTLYANHEISHAIYAIQEIPDNTHIYFYSGNEQKVLPELNQGKLSKMYTILFYIKQAILLLTIQVNQTKIMTPEKPTMELTIEKWANAVKLAEGNAPYLNNPGSLKVSPLTQSWGASRGVQASDGGYIAKFDTYQEGFQALCNFLELGAKNELKAFHSARDITSFTKIYAGGPPAGYIKTIINYLGCSPTTPVSDFLKVEG